MKIISSIDEIIQVIISLFECAKNENNDTITNIKISMEETNDLISDLKVDLKVNSDSTFEKKVDSLNVEIYNIN